MLDPMSIPRDSLLPWLALFLGLCWGGFEHKAAQDEWLSEAFLTNKWSCQYMKIGLLLCALPRTLGSAEILDSEMF